MKTTRRVGLALAGLVVAVAAVGLPGSPASATTADAEITGGTMDVYSLDSNLLSTQSLGFGTAVECSAPTGSIDVDSTGAFSATFSTNTSRTIAGTTFTIVRTLVLTGTITTTGGITATGSATQVLYRDTFGTCSQTATPCTITVSNIVLNGTSTVTTHVMEASDTVTLSGATGDHGLFNFDVSVTGNCGALSAADDGSVTFTGMAFHITDV